MAQTASVYTNIAFPVLGVTYDVAPAPAAFTTADGIRVNTRINYDTISTDSIYIIYYTEADLFKDSFTLTPFYDWYVAVPK